MGFCAVPDHEAPNNCEAKNKKTTVGVLTNGGITTQRYEKR
jgi:hypothetical protein